MIYGNIQYFCIRNENNNISTNLSCLGVDFFSLISNVDQFVFLDQVQFDKRSWQQRNYISVKGEKNF